MDQTLDAIPTYGSYACASFAFMFDEVYKFGAGETITQQYRLVIANGRWDAAQVETAVATWRGS